MTRSLALASALAALALSIAPAAPAGAQASSSGWSVQPSPNAPGAKYSELDAVACPGPAACYAVGFSFAHTAGFTKPLAERWNGSTWALQTIPALPTAGRSFLTGISCAAVDRCIAVGYAVTSSPNVQAVTEAWNGTRWTLLATPQAGKGGASFEAVSCATADSCLAVGGFSPLPGDNEQPLSERWNGSHWTVIPTPSPGDNEYGSGLDGVSCTAATACTAVGSFFFAEVADTLFALRWHGTSWTVQRQPEPGTQKNAEENGVACTGPSACVSAGYWTSFSAAFNEPLVEAWDGSTWAKQRSPQPVKNHLATLNGVSCAGPALCIAVGNWSPVAGGGNPTFGLAELWNGRRWAMSQTAKTGSIFTSLNAIACGSPIDCIAVGIHSTKTAAATLAERYSG